MAGVIKTPTPGNSIKKEPNTIEGATKSLTIPPSPTVTPITSTTKESNPRQKQLPLSPLPDLRQATPWGCLVQTYPTSLAPKSLTLIHNPTTCFCQGREEVIVKDYILRWVSYRINEFKDHPVKAATWARASCEYLGIPGALDGILDRIEKLFVGDDGF